MKNNILNSYKANNNKVTTVIYYEDKIHISSKWNRGYSEYDIRYSDISTIYLSNNTIVFLYNNSTQMLNIIEETLEGVSAEQIIQKIKSSNHNLKIIEN